MKCFYHRDCDAVGICKSCLRGLCPDCAVDLTQGMACRSRCEDDAEAVIRYMQNSIRLSATSAGLVQAGRRTGLMAAGFCLILGAVFIWEGERDGMSFIAIFGVVFVLYGLISFVRYLRIKAPKPQP